MHDCEWDESKYKGFASCWICNNLLKIGTTEVFTTEEVEEMQSDS